MTDGDGCAQPGPSSSNRLCPLDETQKNSYQLRWSPKPSQRGLSPWALPLPLPCPLPMGGWPPASLTQTLQIGVPSPFYRQGRQDLRAQVTSPRTHRLHSRFCSLELNTFPPGLSPAPDPQELADSHHCTPNQDEVGNLLWSLYISRQKGTIGPGSWTFTHSLDKY